MLMHVPDMILLGHVTDLVTAVNETTSNTFGYKYDLNENQGPNSQPILGRSYDNFQTYNNLTTIGEFPEHLNHFSLKTYLKTKSYDHLLDVLKQLDEL